MESSIYRCGAAAQLEKGAFKNKPKQLANSPWKMSIYFMPYAFLVLSHTTQSECHSSFVDKEIGTLVKDASWFSARLGGQTK